MALKRPEIFRISTGMGKVYCMGGKHPLYFLSREEQEELDTIGYTGKNSKGERTNRESYLNSLDKGAFAVTRVRSDNGDFSEEFIIARTVEAENNKSHIKFCVTYTMRKFNGNLEDKFENFEEEEPALHRYEELLSDEKLYTANFCKVIETTG